jgi:hypothetical protein
MALEVMKMAFILFHIKLIHKMSLSGYRILPFAEKAYLVTILLILSSCGSKENNFEKIVLNENNLMEPILLVGENIDVDCSIIPVEYYVLNDSILLYKNFSQNPNFFGLYNLLSRKKIVEFAGRGKGPNELLSAQFMINCFNFSRSENIDVYDLVRKQYLSYNIDSLLNNHLIPVKQISLPDYIVDFSIIDDTTYVYYNRYYLNDSKIKNNVRKVLIFNPNDTDNEIEWKYFSPNVSAAYVLVSPNKDKVFIADYFKDQVDIYDNNLKLIKCIVGPDFVTPQYQIESDNMVGFLNKKRYRGYYPLCFTENHIYALYVGYSGDNNFELLKNKQQQIFKFNWDGVLLQRFILDRYVFSLTINGNENILYSSYYDQNGEVKLAKYIL